MCTSHPAPSITHDVSIRRKPTHTDRPTFPLSPPTTRERRRGLLHRARTVAQGENVAAEEHLRGVLEGNGYPETFVKTASKSRRAAEPIEEPRATAFIPYVAELSEDVRWVCRRYDIRTVLRSSSTLRGQLMRVKDQDPLEKKSNVVYHVPCSCGRVYIGEMKRALETRMKEHKAATRRGELKKSAIAEHAWNHHHQVEWEEIKVLDEAANNTTLLIKEALHIRLTDTETLINRDKGVAISDCWTAILSHARPMTFAASSSTHQ